jgi:hypothetical protein
MARPMPRLTVVVVFPSAALLIGEGDGLGHMIFHLLKYKTPFICGADKWRQWHKSCK